MYCTRTGVNILSIGAYNHRGKVFPALSLSFLNYSVDNFTAIFVFPTETSVENIFRTETSVENIFRTETSAENIFHTETSVENIFHIALDFILKF